MADAGGKIVELSPERRKLLERLLREKRSVAQAPATEAAAPKLSEGLLLNTGYPESPEAHKTSYRLFYDTITRQLDSSAVGAYSYFLNYGYVSNGAREYAIAEPPATAFNLNSIKLVLEVIGDCDLTGRRVLDVGCGRGGTVWTICNYFNAARITGIDISREAIAFNHATHRDPSVAFLEGDAERLPFADASFDAVINIESSHSYPNIQSFYAEVYRVLAGGGYFLYTDLMPVQQIQACVGRLALLGFVVQRDRDVTPNVMLSCDAIANRRLEVFDTHNDRHLMSDFLGAPGSVTYNCMQTGAWQYRIFKLHKAARQPR